MTKLNPFPVAMPDGSLLPHLSAKLRTATMDALYVGAGGFEKHLAHITKNDDNYESFLQAWYKGAARSTNVEVGVSEGVEALLDRLDAGEHAPVVSGTSRVVDEA